MSIAFSVSRSLITEFTIFWLDISRVKVIDENMVQHTEKYDYIISLLGKLSV